VKLESALPGWRFIHTHVGFGYRLAPERSHAAPNVHNLLTGRSQVNNTAARDSSETGVNIDQGE